MVVQLACRWLYSRRCPTVLLKIDIAKAFDSVSWEFLLQLLTYMGFPHRWREWIVALLSTASTRVLVNGRPGRKIWHARGLRQGDPLSPMLFVLVMEVVNAMISAADTRGVLQPLPTNRIRNRASLYADDLVVFLSPVPSDLRCIQEILHLFADATGLVTNMDKCSISPIRCTEEDVAAVLEAFPGQVLPFPCKYLGISLTLLKPSRAEEQPLIDKIAARIPTWKAGLLNHAGRATLTKVTLSAIPVHVSIACGLSSWALRQIDKRRRAFLWAGTESVAGGKCRVAWRTVQAPLCYGGLGFPDLKIAGFALRLR
jgi:hypothetical protein